MMLEITNEHIYNFRTLLAVSIKPVNSNVARGWTFFPDFRPLARVLRSVKRGIQFRVKHRLMKCAVHTCGI